MKKVKNLTVGKVIMWTILLVFAFVQIFPLIWLVNHALASNNEMFTSGILIIPETIRWDNFVTAFVDGHFLLYLRNSVLVNVLAVLLVLILSVMMAFACTRMHWKLSGATMGLILMGMMIPIHATLLPNYIIYDKLHLTDTLWALLLPYVAFCCGQAFL